MNSSKFADETKLSGAVDTQEGRNTIQRDLDRFERWANANLMEFNKAKCLDQGNPKRRHRLAREWLESIPGERIWGCLLMKAQQVCLQFRRPTVFWVE